jgi:hypothetical protein
MTSQMSGSKLSYESLSCNYIVVGGCWRGVFSSGVYGNVPIREEKDHLNIMELYHFNVGGPTKLVFIATTPSVQPLIKATLMKYEEILFMYRVSFHVFGGSLPSVKYAILWEL